MVDKWVYKYQYSTVALTFAGFQWDRGNLLKCQKHGVPFSAIEAMFNWPVAVFPDPAHSRHEERLKAIGKSDDGRSIFIVFTLRTLQGQTFIRPISARYMHRKEIEYYEKEVARTQNR
jgi:uncharacterized DUF497 family protein